MSLFQNSIIRKYLKRTDDKVCAAYKDTKIVFREMMNIVKILVISASFLIFSFCNKQKEANVERDGSDSNIVNVEKENHYDSGDVSPIEKIESAPPDPYFNGHLHKYFNPEQIDFSKEFLELRSKWFTGEEDAILQLINYDFSTVWLTDDSQQNGVLGQNYQRIQIHFSAISRNLTDSTVYLAEGKSKVNSNICNLKGKIKPIKLFVYECDVPSDSSYRCGSLFAVYTFYEDSTKSHSGVFTGIAESSVYIDDVKMEILLDESMHVADGYSNNTFVGIWTNYKTKQSKKCIWGDYRLPFTFDFDCGDGEMIVCDKYVKNGWQTYNYNREYGGHPEYIETDNGKCELKDKWWRK